MAKLADVLPPEFTGGEYHTTAAFKYRDRKVLGVYSIVSLPERPRNWKPWLGRHRNVYNWYVLEGGIAVGWNEGPQGWAFPVIRYRGRAPWLPPPPRSTLTPRRF